MNKKDLIAKLAAGESIANYKESGNSMTPLIKHRQPVTLEPVISTKLEKGDIVFVKVNGRYYTHKITALKKGQVQIGNNHGHINGWTKLENVYGIVTSIDGREIGGAKNKVRKMKLYRIISDDDGHKYICHDEEAQSRLKKLEEFYANDGKGQDPVSDLERAEGDIWQEYVLVKRKDL